MNAAHLIRAARARAAITVAELSRRSAVTGTVIDAIEAGAVDPTYETVSLLLSRTRHRLIVVPSVRADAAELGALIGVALRTGDEATAFRHLIQLSDNLVAERGLVRGALTLEAPEPTSRPVFDAALAGIVEYRLGQEGLPSPGWVDDGWRRLDVPEVLPYGRYTMVVDPADVPAALLARGVLVDRDSLESV